ncbi:MAG: hypothetical protein QF603_08895 [Alphaproteobacteria bacterium]|nr:hypothetical protein [Alphaproteobacteria bacterium]
MEYMSIEVLYGLAKDFYLFAETHPRVDTSPTDFVKWLDEVANVDIWEDEAEALLNGVF